MTRVHLRLVMTAAVLAALAVGSWRMGQRTLRVPSLRSWDEAERWYEANGPAVATMAGLRLAALASALWLLAGAALELLAVLSDGRRARRLADRIAPRSLQRLVHGLAGISLTAGLAVPAPGAGILDPPGAGVAVLRLVDEPPGGGTATMRAGDEPAPAPVAPAARVSEPAPAAAEAVVRPGDSLWSIAEATVERTTTGVAGDRAVAAYWRRLVEANRGRLVDPANPDLIYAGQRFTLPSPP